MALLNHSNGKYIVNAIKKVLKINTFLFECLFVFLIGAPITGYTQSQPLTSPLKPFISFDTFLHSDSSSLDALDNHWQDAYTAGGKNQTASLWFEIGVKKNQWSFSSLYREERELEYHFDTADLYNGLENERTLDAGRRYQIDLTAKRFRAKGLRIAYQAQPFSTLQLTVGGSVFSSSKLLDGSLTGFATANSTNDYDYNAEIDYHYDEDVLLDRSDTSAPKGIGVAIDINAIWNINEQTQVSASIKDLAGVIRWKDVPFTQAQLTSDVKTVSSDGFIEVNPALSGIEGTDKRFTQRLNAYGTLDLRYSLNHSNKTLLVKSRHYHNFSHLGLGGAVALGNHKLGFTFWPQTHVIETMYQTKNHAITFGIDTIDFSKTQTLWLSISTAVR